MPHGGARKAVYASHLSYVLGEPVPIGETADPEVRAELDNLSDQGIRHYLADPRPVPELATAAARPVVDGLSGTAPIGMLVYCTDTPSSEPVTRQMWRVQQDLGLVDTPSVLVSGGGCSNLGAGMTVARAMLATEDIDTVLLVTADRVPGPTGRYLTHGSTVLSDSAAACLLSATPSDAGFRILGMATEVRADIGYTAGQLVRGRAIMKRVGAAVDRAAAEAGVPPADCRYFVTGNFGRTSREFLTLATRCTEKQAYAPWAAELGHCFSADIVVNLSTLLARDELQPGDRLLLLSSSPHSWYVIIVEYRPFEGEGEAL